MYILYTYIFYTVQTLQKERETKLKLDAELSEAQRTIQVLTVDYKDVRQKLERLEQDHEAVLTKVIQKGIINYYTAMRMRLFT